MGNSLVDVGNSLVDVGNSLVDVGNSLVDVGNFDTSLVKIHCNIMSRQFLVDPRIWIRNSIF